MCSVWSLGGHIALQYDPSRSRACQGPMDEFPVLSEEGLWGTGDGHPCWAVRQQALCGCELFPLPAAHWPCAAGLWPSKLA